MRPLTKDNVVKWLVRYSKCLTLFAALYILLIMWIGGFVIGAWSVVFDIGITWMFGALIFLIIYICIDRIIKKE